MFDLIEAGVWGLKRLLAFTETFPKYDDEKTYRDLVMRGLEIVRAEQLQPQQQVPKTVEPTKMDITATDEEVDKHPVLKQEIVENRSECENVATSGSEATKVQHSLKGKRKKKNKEIRFQRLLKFQQKLVNVSGLPPSRLMCQETPKSSVSVRRNLGKEFYMNEKDETSKLGQKVKTEPGFNTSADTPAAAYGVGCQVPMPWFGQPVGYRSGTSSGQTNIPTLCSSSPTLGGGCGEAGWSDARPWVGSGFGNMHQASLGLCSGITSGNRQQSSLCSCSLSCGGVGVPLPQLQPHCVPLVGNPAFCFGCMQVGTMYRIDSV